MKLFTHCAHQFVTLFIVACAFGSVWWLAATMLMDAHVGQLVPTAGLICLLLGTCSLVGAVKEATKRATATITRREHAARRLCLQQPVSVPVQHLPETLNPVSFDASFLFTGMDTSEYASERVPVAAGIDPQEAPITPDEIIAWLEDVVLEDTRPSWEIAADKAFRTWLEQMEPTEISETHVAIPDTALMLPGPDLTVAYYVLGEIEPSFDFMPSKLKAAYLN